MSDEARVRSPVQPGDLVGGKYRVERILGAGGMGVVVAALHTELDQAVALKFILPEAVAGKDAVERFMREARAVARLKSEHVARVYDVGRDAQDNPFMVLELLEGHDLAKLTKQRGPFAVADSVEYVLQVCEALVEAHSAGIVHRDLKPQNVFVSRRLNGTPLVKVLDFGIAKAVGPAAVGQMAITDSQAVIGSPLYMAPEHMRSARAADTRSDIWSLGVILYELLGGQLPFDGETVTEVCIRVVNEAPLSLLTLRPGLDPKLVDIAMRCLEKDPSMRWQTVAQLASALEPFARSAQQGALVRPWRSLEDTMDSQQRPQGPSANDTGPQTVVTMPTGEEVARALRAAPEQDGAPQTALFVPLTSDERERKVATNVSWGGGTDNPVITQTKSSKFTAGIAVGAALAIAAAVIVAVAFRPTGHPSTSAATVAPPTTSVSAEVPKEPPPSPVTAQPVSEPSVVVTTPAPATSVKRPLITQGRARSGASARPATPTVAAPAAAPAPTETQAPNGAPILR